MNKSVYFTLGEIASLEDDTWYPHTASDFNMSTIMTRYSLVIEDSSTTKLNILYQLMRFIFARFYECSIYKELIGIYEDESQIVISNATKKYIWSQFIGMFNLTAPRYIPLLESYKANESSPIAKIKSSTTGVNRFNDTPQDEGDFANDEHTTNISQNNVEVEIDSGSVANRLDELYKNWRSILRDWTNEFRCLFYDGGI
jgi:hypothetical protein